jgi:transposase
VNTRGRVQTHAPQAQILFHKFHILRHLAEAMKQVRQAEYQRVAAKDRAFIMGQRYTFLAHRANLTLAGRQSLKKLLRANDRLATPYPAERRVLATVGLPTGRVGATVLHPLAGTAQVATVPAL